MIRNVQDQALANIIGKVAELPVTVKGYTDDVVQQMDERHRAFRAHPTNPVEGCADANPKTMLPNDT